ncbi:MAG: formylglycine-generating enzyme family protein [Myxococcales bacterium]|nr:formylglycine-generating enzyme family protein [Myxococcales bacterium]
MLRCTLSISVRLALLPTTLGAAACGNIVVQPPQGGGTFFSDAVDAAADPSDVTLTDAATGRDGADADPADLLAPHDDGPSPADADVDSGSRALDGADVDDAVTDSVGEGDGDANVPETAGGDTTGPCATDADCLALVQPVSPCQVLACVAGQCVPKAVADGTGCGGGKCVTLQGVTAFDGTVCVFGTCSDQPVQLSCQDGALCTFDGCDSKKGCTHEPQTAACNDNNPCTAETCDAALGCLYTPTAAACTDGDSCTANDACAGGLCKGGAGSCSCQVAVDCAGKDPCVPLVCKDSVCAGKPTAGAACDDGNACSSADTCGDGGVCAGKPTACDDGIDCTLDACDKLTGCVNLPSPLACDDGNACTLNTCAAKQGCSATPTTDTACIDGNACTEGDACKAGKCVAGPAKACVAGTACEVALCEPFTGLCGLAAALDGKTCDDGNACSLQDSCAAGLCVGKQNPCDDKNPCTYDGCEADGKCKHTAQTGPCDADQDLCTEGDHCKDSACLAGAAKLCDDKNACTTQACDGKKGCVVKPVTVGVACGLDQYCSAGKCTKAVAPAGMAFVAGATFAMGCNAAVDSQCKQDEKPSHDVALLGFFVDKTEVTAAGYTKCVDAGACSDAGGLGQPDATVGAAGKEAMPVNFVNWAQAGTYCAFAGGGRRCTEAEWELAARGKDARRYPWGNAAPTCALANFAGCLPKGPHAVGASPQGQSPTGQHDMAGNVREWVADWYGAETYAGVPKGTTNPKGPVTGTARVLRGGWFGDGAAEVRTSARAFAAPATLAASVGFRCCRDPK